MADVRTYCLSSRFTHKNQINTEAMQVGGIWCEDML